MFDEIRQLVDTRFKAQWALINPAIPYAVDGIPFPQPKAGSWLRLAVIPGNGDRESIGGSKVLVKMTGVVSLQIFTDKNKGTGPAKQLGDSAAPIFELQQFKQGQVVIDFRVAYQVKAGERPDYYQENLWWPYDAYLVK